MASKKSKKAKRVPRHFRQKGLKGKKENVFYFDVKSGHPFVSQSKDGSTVYGHNVTHSPSKNPDGSVKAKYRKFPSRIRKGDAKPSFFDSTLERIDNSPKPGKKNGRLQKKDWKVSNPNRKTLKKAEKSRLTRAKRKAR